MYARRPSRPKPRKSLAKKWAAPVAGWVANRALADPASIEGPGAAVLDNFFPKATTVTLRRGSRTVAQLSDPSRVVAMFGYNNGTNERLFAATASGIFDVTAARNIAVPSVANIVQADAIRGGTVSGNWSVVQFATSGGVYLIGVNGADPGFVFDGQSFGLPAFTFPGGLTSADMAYVWAYKGRLLFARRGTMTAYYLDIDSIGGVATAFPLGGVFGQGGELLFGAAWSLDSSGDAGLSEQCVFVSSEGEVAVYQGTDPSSASDWQRVGVYRIGAPLGRRAFFRGGGDLAIATSVGLVPLSKAVSLEVTALSVATISFKIADAWSDAVARGYADWQCHVWPEAKMAIVAPAIENAQPMLFVSNTETGAWGRFTGWDASSFQVFNGRLYFGSADGRVVLASASGDDDGVPYTGRLLPLFEDMDAPMSTKVATVGRARVMSNAKLKDRVTLAAEFNTEPPADPDADTNLIVSQWDVVEWGSGVWSDARPSIINQDWQSLGGTGYSVSIWYQVTSGNPAPLDAEVIGLEMMYTATEAMG